MKTENMEEKKDNTGCVTENMEGKKDNTGCVITLTILREMATSALCNIAWWQRYYICFGGFIVTSTVATRTTESCSW